MTVACSHSYYLLVIILPILHSNITLAPKKIVRAAAPLAATDAKAAAQVRNDLIIFCFNEI